MPPYAGPPVTARSGESPSTPRLLAYLAMALVLIVLGTRVDWLARLRGQATVLVQPIWALAGLPGRLGTQVQENAASHAQLVRENTALRNQLLIAKARLTRLQTAALDNAQLRELLGVAEHRGLDVQLAPILDIDLDPTRQRLVLDAGSRDGVRLGQSVIDAGGLMGQVIAVTPLHSTVLLLTDPDHAVPVTVARNGVRLIVYGRGNSLELRDIPLSAGVEVGDEIVTSGLGGRFPAGFPVGTISALRPDDTHAFLVGELKPAAKLDRGRDVLLLKPGLVDKPRLGAALMPAGQQDAGRVAVPATHASESQSAAAANPPIEAQAHVSASNAPRADSSRAPALSPSSTGNLQSAGSSNVPHPVVPVRTQPPTPAAVPVPAQQESQP
ncbi:rod shape-determining protein MreC, partial [Xanthomonas sp. MUS 060]|uniref:rod shape-determining protein MreC n=1 Tax=Xanthomonas sp. MUS 060 TaxID=1588031 RepID=UPI0005F2BB21